MYKWLLILLFHCCILTAATPCLKEKLSKGQVGDFFVTAQDGNYSLLSIRSLNSNLLVLEEISVPAKQIDLKHANWKKWVTNKAPGHTSWTLLEIDLASGKLLECFSVSKNAWAYLDDSEQFFTRLLCLPLDVVTDSQRKKIGPAPNSGEPDCRSCWNPPLVIEGKKVEKPQFEVVKARWPDDGSQLALCVVELYFAEQLPTFPCWLEVQSPHYTFKMRAVDTGRGLISPIKGGMPHRNRAGVITSP